VNMNSRLMMLPSRNKIRTLVVDDSSTILHAICSLLEHQKIVDVVGRARSGREALSKVAELRPDLVLIDAEMPGMSGLRAALLLAQASPRTGTIVMSMDATPQFRRACFDCGASAVIYKPKFLAELKVLLRGDQPRVPRKLLQRSPRPSFATAATATSAK
jgi:DNA-binding NarL/FixJ family response regulator